MLEKLKNYYNMVVLPYGIDKDYDTLCSESFVKFIDRVYDILLFFYVFVAVGSTYFFVKHELLYV